ncbi:unnamed protein product [Parascedosporium putredinis]|uniref:Zn(2)-C6 fungal-type domain-containing protein n=1 Tax=Parascedosporium putredinis TaxID=1442378 RepID=A0A9P1M7V4_9PEZI|nr:unnamed protein product [Parascedosporium putredinis]CAI7988961.1 unnamed protein product [Parascedosporium putredinis]
MADSPPSPDQYHAYASNGLQVLQAATNAHQAIFQDSQTQDLGDQHHDLQQAAQQAAQQHLQQQEHQQHDEQQQQQQQQQHDHQLDQDVKDIASTLPETPGHQHLAIAPNPLDSSPARIIADPAALAAVAAAAGAQDAFGHDALTQEALAHEALAARAAQDAKVKCDAIRPCKPCMDLNLECTNNRVVKRRGPPNKAVEAIRLKKRLTEAAAQDILAGGAIAQIGSYTSTTPHSAAQALVSIAGNEPGVGLDGEAIAPRPILEALVDDFFTYIHPLCPFPHQPTFQAAFVNRDDRTDPEFLALLASMIGALVSSFPRTARAHLKSQQSVHIFPRAIVMIEKCRDIALEARGAKWSSKQPKSLNDAATSYFLALSAGYTLQFNLFRLHLAEALSVMNELGFNRPKHPGDLPTFGNDTCERGPDKLPFNHIKDQVGKKIFWCIFLGVRSLFQLGASHAGLFICPPTPSQPYPAYPANADDKDIQANEVLEQDPTTTTLMTGFRIAADIYMTMNGIVSVEMAYGLDSLKWSGQRQLMKEGLAALVSNDQQGAPSNVFDDQGLEYVPPGNANAQGPHDVRQFIKTQPARRRLLQLEIQKANVFTSQLATRSYFVELYFSRRNLYDPDIQLLAANSEASDEEREEMREEESVRIMMTQERDQIIDDLLLVLGGISQRNLEPNGNSIITKIRQRPGRDPLSDTHKEALSSLLLVLTRLEKTGSSGAPNESMTDQEEEEELSHWASLRDYQMRFSAHGDTPGTSSSRPTLAATP